MLEDTELAMLTNAHDLLQKIDSFLYENEEDDFNFDRDTVSCQLLRCMNQLEEIGIKLVGYTRWMTFGRENY